MDGVGQQSGAIEVVCVCQIYVDLELIEMRCAAS